MKLDATNATGTWLATVTPARSRPTATSATSATGAATGRSDVQTGGHGAAGVDASKAAVRTTKAKQEFEAFFLQVMLGSMMPEENNKVFGAGSSGKIWQSMLSEQLAKQISASGRLQILGEREFGAATKASADRAAGGEAAASPAVAVREAVRSLSGPTDGSAGWTTRIEKDATDDS